MFRFAFIPLALIAFGAVLAGGAGALGAGLLVLAPLFILGKILLIVFLFGAMSGFFRRGYNGSPSRPWTRRWASRRSEEPKEKSRTEQFEEWHRLAHAREEVDGWIEDLD